MNHPVPPACRVVWEGGASSAPRPDYGRYGAATRRKRHGAAKVGKRPSGTDDGTAPKESDAEAAL